MMHPLFSAFPPLFSHLSSLPFTFQINRFTLKSLTWDLFLGGTQAKMPAMMLFFEEGLGPMACA